MGALSLLFGLLLGFGPQTQAVGNPSESIPVGSAPLTITSVSPLPNAIIDQEYGHQLTASGGSAPYSWRVVSGRLPLGLILTSAGVIGGIPYLTGTSSFRVRLTDAQQMTAETNLTLAVITPPAIPNLAFDWQYPLYLSKPDGSPVSSYYQDEDVIVSSVVRNRSGAHVTNAFATALYLNGTFVRDWQTSFIGAGDFRSVIQYYNLGKLSVGNHTLRVFTDWKDEITEWDEADNTHERAFSVLVQAGLPNLVPSIPPEWSDAIVASHQKNDFVGATALYDDQDIFVARAFQSTTNAVANSFVSALYLDNQLLHSEPFNGLSPPWHGAFINLNVGKLTAGTHALRMVVDAENSIIEQNETDNSYTKELTVVHLPEQLAVVSPTVIPPTGQEAAAVLAFSFLTRPGQHYAIESKSSLNHNFWLWLRTIIGDGRTATFSDRIDSRSRIYHVRTEPNPLRLKFPLAGAYSANRITDGGKFGVHWEEDYCKDAGKESNRLLHIGTDFAAVSGEVVYAVGNCAVKFAAANEDAGGFIVLEHPSGYTITYTHVLIDNNIGDTVIKGHPIGTISSGKYPPHLHIQVRKRPYSQADINVILVGRLPENDSCTRTRSGTVIVDPPFPEQYINPESVVWE